MVNQSSEQSCCFHPESLWFRFHVGLSLLDGKKGPLFYIYFSRGPDHAANILRVQNQKSRKTSVWFCRRPAGSAAGGSSDSCSDLTRLQDSHVTSTRRLSGLVESASTSTAAAFFSPVSSSVVYLHLGPPPVVSASAFTSTLGRL